MLLNTKCIQCIRILYLISFFPSFRSRRVRHTAWQLLQHHHIRTEWHILRFEGRNLLSTGLSSRRPTSAHLLGYRSMEQCITALRTPRTLYTNTDATTNTPTSATTHSITVCAVNDFLQTTYYLDFKTAILQTYHQLYTISQHHSTIGSSWWR